MQHAVPPPASPSPAAVVVRCAILCLLPLSLTLCPIEPPPAQAQRIQKKQPRYVWYRVTTDEGIEVHAKDHPNRDLPSFRGVGMVEASIYNVMAVLDDAERHVEWMDRCVESRIIRRIDPYRRIVYNRTAAMWPVADRDVVVLGGIEFDRAAGIAMLRFRSLRDSGVPRVDGVVRMENLSGHYRLARKGPHRTHVTFEVDADPGGSLPKFIVKWASRDMPIKTIKALRKQAQDMGGRRGQQVQHWKKNNPFD